MDTAYISDVLRVGEVGQVSVVELLTLQVFAVLSRLQITSLDAIGLKKLLVGYSKCLTYSLGYGLSLDGETRCRKRNRLRFQHCYHVSREVLHIPPALFYPPVLYKQINANERYI